MYDKDKTKIQGGRFTPVGARGQVKIHDASRFCID